MGITSPWRLGSCAPLAPDKPINVELQTSFMSANRSAERTMSYLYHVSILWSIYDSIVKQQWRGWYRPGREIPFFCFISSAPSRPLRIIQYWRVYQDRYRLPAPISSTRTKTIPVHGCQAVTVCDSFPTATGATPPPPKLLVHYCIIFSGRWCRCLFSLPFVRISCKSPSPRNVDDSVGDKTETSPFFLLVFDQKRMRFEWKGGRSFAFVNTCERKGIGMSSTLSFLNDLVLGLPEWYLLHWFGMRREPVNFCSTSINEKLYNSSPCPCRFHQSINKSNINRNRSKINDSNGSLVNKQIIQITISPRMNEA